MGEDSDSIADCSPSVHRFDPIDPMRSQYDQINVVFIGKPDDFIDAFSEKSLTVNRQIPTFIPTSNVGHLLFRASSQSILEFAELLLIVSFNDLYDMEQRDPTLSL